MKKHLFLFSFCCFQAILFTADLSAQNCLELNVAEIPTIQCSENCEEASAVFTETFATDSYEVLSTPYNPPIPFSEGSPIIAGYDDIWSEAVDLPFDFCFFGNTFDQISIGANGVVTFNMALASPPGFDLTTATYCEWSFFQTMPNAIEVPYHNSISGAYHDVDPFIGGDIFISTIGEYPCRKFIVNYDELPHYGNFWTGSSWCNFITTSQQIVLHEGTNVVEVFLGSKPTCSDWNSGNAVLGI